MLTVNRMLACIRHIPPSPACFQLPYFVMLHFTVGAGHPACMCIHVHIRMLHHASGALCSCSCRDGLRQRRSGFLALMHHHPFGANYKSTNMWKRVGQHRDDSEVYYIFSRQLRSNRCSRVPTDFWSCQRHHCSPWLPVSRPRPPSLYRLCRYVRRYGC